MHTEQEYAQAQDQHLAASGNEYDNRREVLNIDQELEYAQAGEEHMASPNEYDNTREVLEVEQELE